MSLVTLIQILFWLALALVFWANVGYFIFLKLLSAVYGHQVDKKEWTHHVSIVITAYNEEKRLAEKIENTLALNFPKERLEIIVVSDASTDRTNEIVQSYADRGVTLLAMPNRHGKHYGQGQGIEYASSEVIVLSDATTFLEPDAITKIVANFSDPTIGCVSGQDRVMTIEGNSQGEGAYVRYEMALRELESRVGSLVGVSGSFFATRKTICDGWISNMSSDFYLPIIAAMRGYRSVSEPEAVGLYKVLHDPQKEFTRKVRTVVHGLEVLFHFKAALNPVKYGLFALQLFSHKLSRWLVPFCMIAALPLNYLLLDTSFLYALTMALQLLFYILVTASFLAPRLQDKQLFRLAGFFALVNYSILVAWYKYWTKQEFVVWDATRR